MKAFDFWKRVDENNPYKTVKELSMECGIVYNRMKKNRSDVRLPSIEDAFSLAQAEGVSVEFLLTGKDSRPMSEGERLYQALLEHAPAVLQGLVAQYLSGGAGSSVASQKMA